MVNTGPPFARSIKVGSMPIYLYANPHVNYSSPTAAASALEYDSNSQRLFVGLGSGLLHVSQSIKSLHVNYGIVVIQLKHSKDTL